jgi:hypothetical protein
MLRLVALVRIEVSEEGSTSIIRVPRIGELGTTLAVSSNRRSVRRLLIIGKIIPIRRLLLTANAVPSSPILVITRATRRNIPQDGILNSHRREIHKPYKLYIIYSYALVRNYWDNIILKCIHV